MVAIIDYGVGNLFSLQSSFAAIGAEVTVTADKEVLEKADCIILPGVGAFEDAAKKLRSTGLDQTLKELAAKGKPLMGICLGMQLLFEKSYEYGCHEGLGLLKGSVRPIRDVIPQDHKTPHIGWNGLIMKKESPLMKYIHQGDCVYFVHSYYLEAGEEEMVKATTEYGTLIHASVEKGNVFACQFHPEKSSNVGLQILKNFIEITKN